MNGISRSAIYEFMLTCSDNEYQNWWPGTHLAFHTVKRYPNNLGNLVYFDEYVGKRRLTFNAIVTELIPGKRIVWQMVSIVRLPAWLSIDMEDHGGDVKLMHTLTIGLKGLGTIFDPILKLYCSNKFRKELDVHAQTEFRALAKLLSK